VSVLAIAHFEWVVCERVWRGAMIGMVYTDPAWRGHGLASQLLGMAEGGFVAERLDFGVLWTNNPGFYAREGWVLADSGYFASLSLDSPGEEAGGAICRRNPADNRAWIESLRQHWRPKRVLRDTAGYHRLPIPSESLEVAVVNGGGRKGYALMGRCDDTVFLYEMVGHPQCFPELWRAVTRQGTRVMINETCGSAAGKWLRCHTRASWQVQRQALWRPLSDRARAAPLDEWHIPYFDRI
jgi:GNAT superfamily N-acetyltransferase